MHIRGNSIGLYIHIPFCKSKCYYCDFNSYASREDLIPAYIQSLKDEIRYCSQKFRDYSFKTVFIGGGTPSLLDAHLLYDILNTCRQNFRIEENAETSLESNPGTLSYEKLTAYRAVGINRLSIGLQAWQDRLLADIGRIHRLDDFLESFALAKKAGFKNINVDLIFGLPGQTINDWRESVVNAVRLGVPHLSCYSLKIEEDTVFGRRLADGNLAEVDDEMDRRMYSYTINRLEGNGFKHYEISNFAKPGFECRHNLIYWKAEEYLGLGAGAHSYIEGERYNNACSIEKYTASVSGGIFLRENVQCIDKNEAMNEFMILGLRLMDGIDAGEFKERFGEDIFEIFGSRIERLVKKQLLEKADNVIRLTTEGLDLANQVFMEFV